jgi:hypothetical protein
VNNINNQLNATITILLVFESAQHVSGNLLPIFCPVTRTSNLLQHWTIHHIAVNTVLRSSKINKIVIVASSWSFILFTYIDDVRPNTNQIVTVVFMVMYLAGCSSDLPTALGL